MNTIEVNGFPNCALNISGGSVGTLDSQSGNPYNVAAPKVTISGGSVQALTSEGTILNMTGGSLGSLNIQNQYSEHGYVLVPSTIISGGSVGPLTVSGSLTHYDMGQPNLEYDTVNISGGTFTTLTAFNYGGFDLFGTDLALSASGYVTGFLNDGEAVNAFYANTDGNGFLDFNHVAVIPGAVPEASTTVSLGLLLVLGAGGLALAKRRAKPAASSA